MPEVRLIANYLRGRDYLQLTFVRRGKLLKTRLWMQREGWRGEDRGGGREGWRGKDRGGGREGQGSGGGRMEGEGVEGEGRSRGMEIEGKEGLRQGTREGEGEGAGGGEGTSGEVESV